MKNNLKSSEGKLVRSFVFSAIIFLMIFEGIFLASRYFIEKEANEQKFLEDTNKMVMSKMDLKNRAIPFFFGIDEIETDNSGKILNSRLKTTGSISVENITDILDKNTLIAFKENKNQILYFNGYLIRKMQKNGNICYFITKERIDTSTIWRDIWRFLLLDMALILPIWFFMQRYIRKTLLPVQENLDTMTHFVHDAGHELKTPLAIMSGNLQILRDSPKMDYELIENSLETIDTMNETIGWLLELADIKIPDKTEKTYIKPLIENEIQRVKNDKNIEIIDTTSPDFTVFASQKHLSILLRNLIENAVKYNKNGGKVEISNQKNTLIIADTGIGMEKDDLKRIFDRFYRIHQNSGIAGSGIGMTLVDKILKLYEWKIDIQSQIDVGTTIRIIFQK